jgi:hypothetical protein
MTSKSLEAYLLPRPRHGFALALAVCGLALVAAALGLLGWRQFNKTHRLETQLAQLQQEQAARKVPPPSRQQQDEEKQWAQLKLERDFPWDNVFHAIERTASPDIELLEFHPDKPNRVIVLRGEVKNIDALIAYLDSLTVKTGWAGVHLTHQEKVKHGALETISFEVKATLP